MRKTITLWLGMCLVIISFNADALADTIANAAADYVAAAGSDTAVLTTPPPGWSYLSSTAANGGIETALEPRIVGFEGFGDNPDNQGFEGISADSNFASVLGTNTSGSAEFEIFDNGQFNEGVVGTDLLLHPAVGPDFLILRYTVSDANLVADSGSITGNFRELINGASGSAQSVAASVYHNSNLLFDVRGGADAQGTPSILEQATGTFNLTGLTLSEGDTIDFVLGNNGTFFADETALQAVIEADIVPTLLGDVNRDGTVDFLDILPFISLLASDTFQSEADTNQDGMVDFLDISSFISLLSQ